MFLKRSWHYLWSIQLLTMNGLSHVHPLNVLSLVRNLPRDAYVVMHAHNDRAYVCVSHREMWVIVGISVHADRERVRVSVLLLRTLTRVTRILHVVKCLCQVFLGTFHARVRVMNKVGY